MKICKKCGISKDDINDFYFYKDKRSNNLKGGYISSICKECTKKKEREYNQLPTVKQKRHQYNISLSHKGLRREYYKKYQQNNKSKGRNYRLKFKYNITLKQYNDLLKSQNGVCAICKNPPKENKNLHVDHNHLTEENRGLLCDACNFVLGLVKENTNTLNSAINYLNFYTNKRCNLY